jgi:DNA-binding SARP family transcriptional activator
MRFGMLGPLRVWNGDGWTSIRAAQQRVVLAVLLIEAGRPVSTDRLIDEIWGERPPRSALVTVQGYVRRLRLLLGDHAHEQLRTRGKAYELTAGHDEVDAGAFERFAHAGTRALAAGDLDKAAAVLTEALDLWHGPALEDVPAGPIVAAEAARLHQRRLAVLEDRVGALLDLGRHAEVVDELRRAVDAHPLRERLRRQLMEALHRCGRRVEALQTYREARQVMLAELGAEPGPELRRLEHAILTEDSRPLARPITPAVPAQLPADIAGFTGREDHLARLDALAHAGPDAASAVVITGMAGAGKTALAVHWTHRVRHRFPDGQLYVNLRGYGSGAPLRPGDALASFLPALGLPAEQVPVDEDAAAGRYRTLLADRRVLILLDNAADADQIRPLLPGGQGCLVLVTSRDRLDGLVARDGAVPTTLGVLTPAESVRLLGWLLGAERVRAEARATSALAALCGHMPLALRIAAANLSAQPDRAIADYAAQLTTGDRLSALTVPGDPPADVRAAFDHSYTALPTGARTLFRLLGVAPGADISAAAAAALAGVSPTRAAGLLDRLTVAHLLDEHAHGRYTQHELLRLYAVARSRAEDGEPERQVALARLHNHYLEQTTGAAGPLSPHVLRLPGNDAGPAPSTVDDPAPALAWLDAELANLVATVADAAEHGPRPVAWRLADALFGYLSTRASTADWRVIAHAALAAARADGVPHAQAAGHLSLATLARRGGHNQLAADHLTEALELARRTGWAAGEASALSDLGLQCWVTGWPEKAIVHYTQALAIARRTGWLSGQAANLRRLGHAYRGLGWLERSVEQHIASRARYRRMRSRSGEARTLSGLGEAYRALGRLDDAIAALNAGIDLHRQFGDRGREAEALRLLAAVHRDAGHAGRALELATTALTLARYTGNQPIEAGTRNTLGTILDHLGRPRDALGEHRAALRLARTAGNRYTEAEALLGLAAAHRHAGARDAALEHAQSASTIARQAGFRLFEGDALITLAEVRLDQGHAEEAAGHVERALALHTRTGHALGQARAHLLAEQAMRHAGRDRRARDHHQQAAALLDRMGADVLATR